jgi:XTP/dITP diphosphohydrolase
MLYGGPEDPEPLIAQGAWEGVILDAPRGQGGFGYDPLFWVPDLAATAAELGEDEKNRRSHRGIAMRALRAVLETRPLQPSTPAPRSAGA